MKSTTILRWWIALHLAASGIAWAIPAALFHPDVRPYWFARRVLALGMGMTMLVCALLLAVRRRGEGPGRLSTEAEPGSGRKLLQSATDGFLVFSMASFLFNLFLVVFRRYDLEPTFDVIHLIPTGLTNAVWEDLISRSGGSLVLFLSSVVIFDGVVGVLVGTVMSPLRLIPRSRVGIVVLELALFCGYECALAKWFLFRC